MITKTHIVAQKSCCRRQLNAVVKVPFVLFFHFSFFPSFFVMSTLFKQQLENGSSTHRNFSMKLMLTTARSCTTTQSLHSFKCSLDNKHVHNTSSCSPLRRMLILYACAHAVLFPDQRPRLLVWERARMVSPCGSGKGAAFSCLLTATQKSIALVKLGWSVVM